MELYPYEREHIDALRTLAPECMVLLKSNGQFPLEKPCRVALFGSGARKTVKGGTGSGDVNSRYYTTVEDGLENAGFTVTTKNWLDGYDAIHGEARKAFVAGIKAKAKAAGVPAIFLGLGAVMPEPEYSLPLDTDAEAAVYVLSRVSGEGADRKPVPGDFMLTETEIRDILALDHAYARFMLVLNVGGVVDLSPVAQVGNILLLSQLGVVTGDAFADVLLGRAYPSGKLSATWATWEDYPTIGEFGNKDDTAYREGIYVGYRYFDAVRKTPLFPFGYGLGYTSFEISGAQAQIKGTMVQITADVRNTGAHPGKETLQAYVKIPSHRLDQPRRVLAAFAKSGELRPGEVQSVSLDFPMEQLASFDEALSASVLEPGDYGIFIGTDSRRNSLCAIVRLKEEVILRQLSTAGGDCGFADWKPEELCEELTDAPVFHLSAPAFSEAPIRPARPDPAALELSKQLPDSDLAHLCVGNYRSGEESKSVIGAAGKQVVGAAGETCDRIRVIPCLVMADGPAGLRLDVHCARDEHGVYSLTNGIPAAVLEFMDDELLAAFGVKNDSVGPRHGEPFEQYCTAIPIGTALAQSWNTEVCRKCGDMIGSEMERFGVHLWLAPAFNIQRNPLCGRNFEYLSEDPLISGKIAAAITDGVQKHPGRGVTVKHFCCNNQETNRFRTNSVVSRRALRDIYLKPFEICIRESSPAALMTSYNLLNGTHTSERRDLLLGILREEWGYGGLIMTDWITKLSQASMKYPYASAAKSVAAGNELIMPGGEGDYLEIMQAVHGGEMNREILEQRAAYVISAALRLTGAQELA